MEALKQMNKPNFLVVGVPKGGTSSLYSYLKEHTERYLPNKKNYIILPMKSFKNI